MNGPINCQRVSSAAAWSVVSTGWNEGTFRKSTWGSSLFADLDQGTCRDLLCYAMARLPDVVMHVHDETVRCVPARLAEVALQSSLLAMSTPPAWAAGFPLKVEGHAGPRWVKAALPGYVEGSALRGEVLKFGLVE